ncbi:MAG: DUF6305 family protein [Candidatus Aminicenantes bacterium]|nr:DUF6305 family protein [Candidatus Aminicenantes bacterium]
MKSQKMTLLSLIIVSYFLFLSTQPDLPRFWPPALITSGGQNAEVQMVAILAKRINLEHQLNKMATAQDLTNFKSILLVLGASLKGLGAAGLDTNKEMDRVKGLIEAAQQKNIPILCLHLGGEERRGAQSDEFIKAFLPAARMAIVVKAGNKDGLFSKICQEKGILLIEIEKITDALEPLKRAFNI